jgi:hypothetical protein
LAFVFVQTVLQTVKNRFVLGILAVLCLQICFQVLQALERADERYSRVKVSTPRSEPVDPAAAVPDIASLADERAMPGTTAERRMPTRHFERTAPRFALAVASIERRQFTPPTRYALAAKQSIPQKSKDLQKPVRPEARENDRGSFIARVALPVIKKPYDFFKFVGSKLR